MCGAWALEEARGCEAMRAMESRPAGILQTVMKNLRKRPMFYSVYTATCGVAWFFTVALPDVAVALTGVWTQFINGLLMPPIVFALWYLASYKLPDEHKLGPCLKW